jgi:hypothetical protein
MNNKSALLATLFATSGFSGDTKTPFLLNDGENSYEDLTLQKLHKLELLKKKQKNFFRDQRLIHVVIIPEHIQPNDSQYR